MALKLTDPAADLYLDGRVKETTVLEAVDAASRDALSRMESLIFVPELEGPPAPMAVVIRSTPLKAVNPFVRWSNPRDIKPGDRIVLGVDGAMSADGPGRAYVVQSVDTRGYAEGGWNGRWHTFSMGCHVHREPCDLCQRQYLGDFTGLKDRHDALFPREDVERAMRSGVRMTDKQREDALRVRRPPTGDVIDDPVLRLQNWLSGLPVTQQARIDTRDLFPIPKRRRITDDEVEDDVAFAQALASLRSLPQRKKLP